MKLNLRLKILISIFIAIGLGFAIYSVYEQSPNNIPTDELIGEIHFMLYDESQTLVVDDQLSIYRNDTLFTLLNRHYDLVCADNQYQADSSCSYRFVQGYALLGIDDVITDWHSTFLSIYINDKIALTGVSGIEPKDDDTIEIKVIADE